MKRKSNLTLSFRAAITLFALLMTMTVWAAQEPVRYIGMDGKTEDGAMPYEILRNQLDFLK